MCFQEPGEQKQKVQEKVSLACPNLHLVRDDRRVHELDHDGEWMMW